MNSFSRSPRPVPVDGLGLMAGLIFAVGLFSAAPMHQAWGQTYNPDYMQEIKDGLRDAYTQDIFDAEDLLGCDTNDFASHSRGSDPDNNGASEPARGPAGGCNNSATTPTGTAWNDKDRNIGRKTFNSAFREGPGAPPVEYFVKERGGAVMACAVRFDATKQPPAGSLKQNAVYHPGINPHLGNNGHAFIATAAAFFNQLSPLSEESPTQRGLRILTQAGGGGLPLQCQICAQQDQTTICEQDCATDMQSTADHLAALQQSDMQLKMELQGSSAFNQRGAGLKENASLIQTANGVAAARRNPQGVIKRGQKDTAEKTDDISDHKLPKGNEGQSGNCDQQSAWSDDCSGGGG
jgi:hypothetical protein